MSTNPCNPDALDQKKLLALIEQETGSHGLIALMMNRSVQTRCDVPAAEESYFLLRSAMASLEEQDIRMLQPGCAMPTATGVHVLPAAADGSQRLIAITRIEAETLGHIAHWLCANLLSDKIRQMPGNLYTLFEVRPINGERHLFPEWFSLFLTSEGGCIPLLAMKSMLHQEGMDDWVEQSWQRMQDYGFQLKTISPTTPASAGIH